MTAQQRADLLLCGWQAAERREPIDPHQPSSWREGWMLRQQTRVRRPRGTRYARVTRAPTGFQ